uniref:Uncharacterized protein n=1 Tax=Acrobeloides nanus TaxID=290746 RepID=A0A914EKY2_9BILA
MLAIFSNAVSDEAQVKDAATPGKEQEVPPTNATKAGKHTPKGDMWIGGCCYGCTDVAAACCIGCTNNSGRK